MERDRAGASRRNILTRHEETNWFHQLPGTPPEPITKEVIDTPPPWFRYLFHLGGCRLIHCNPGKPR